MYGAKLIIKNQNLAWENTLAGYSGWINRRENYGNKPLAYTSKIIANWVSGAAFIQYQYGIRHFPYQQIRLGIEFPLEILTPTY